MLNIQYILIYFKFEFFSFICIYPNLPIHFGTFLVLGNPISSKTMNSKTMALLNALVKSGNCGFPVKGNWVAYLDQKGVVNTFQVCDICDPEREFIDTYGDDWGNTDDHRTAALVDSKNNRRSVSFQKFSQSLENCKYTVIPDVFRIIKDKKVRSKILICNDRLWFAANGKPLKMDELDETWCME